LTSSQVTVIIMAQIACWVPILIATALSIFYNVKISALFYEIAAIVILPLNSILDPILYTNVMREKFVQFARCVHGRSKEREETQLHVIAISSATDIQ